MKVYVNNRSWTLILLALLSLLSACASVKPVERQSLYAPMSTDETARLQREMSALPVGERIAFWAESFVGAPYDTDPLGAYVRQEKAVCDTEVDCMYHVFRSVELATSGTPDEAVQRALELRFKTRGVIVDGRITNYAERYEYGEDMVASGKWGEDVSATLGNAGEVAGSRGHDRVIYLPKDELLKPENYARLKSGDLIFFIKDPARRVVGEIVGHLGVVKAEGGKPFLIHASGSKAREGSPGGGAVRKVDLLKYLSGMKFIGVVVTRFPDQSRH